VSLGIGDAPCQQLPGGHEIYFFQVWGMPPNSQTQRDSWQGERVYQFEVDVEYLIWRNTSVETKRKTKTHVFQILSIHPASEYPKNHWILQQ